jgi:hypothetical protein
MTTMMTMMMMMTTGRMIVAHRRRLQFDRWGPQGRILRVTPPRLEAAWRLRLVLGVRCLRYLARLPR